jgi:hypothetical protein
MSASFNSAKGECHVNIRCTITPQFAKLVLDEGVGAARKDLYNKRRLAAKAAREKCVDASNAVVHALTLARDVASEKIKAAAETVRDTVKRKWHH